MGAAMTVVMVVMMVVMMGGMLAGAAGHSCGGASGAETIERGDPSQMLGPDAAEARCFVDRARITLT
jgi:hypothetical protein